MTALGEPTEANKSYLARLGKLLSPCVGREACVHCHRQLCLVDHQALAAQEHPRTGMDVIASQYGWHVPRQKTLRWRDGDTAPVPLAAIRVVRYWQGTDPGPHYASTSTESPVRNERRTPGSARGIRKPSGRNP
jgi:hypothetical protein